MQSGAGAPDISCQQGKGNQTAGIVSAVRMLRDTHTPEDDGTFCLRIAAGNGAQVFRRDPANGGHGFGGGVGGTFLECLKAFSVLGHVIAVIQLFTDDHIDHRVQHGDIAARGKAQRGGGITIKMLAARIQNIEAGSVDSRILDKGGGHRMVHGRVGTDDNDGFGVATFGKGGRYRARADIFKQCRN